jgi:elongation factor G
LVNLTREAKDPKESKERLSKLYQVSADDLQEITEIRVGDIGAAMGIRSTCTGDTVISAYRQGNPVLLPGIQTPPPVFFCAVEPDSVAEEKNLNEALRLLQMEDPSFHLNVDNETGQLLVSGMGELHLEIIKDRLLNHYGVKASMGKISILFGHQMLLISTRYIVPWHNKYRENRNRSNYNRSQW